MPGGCASHEADEDWTQTEGGLCYSQTRSAWKWETFVEGAGMGRAVGRPQREASSRASPHGRPGGEGQHCVLGPGCPDAGRQEMG